MTVHLCHTVPIGSMADSRTDTLCDKCKCRDCENPIESKLVSIVGINKKMRVYSTKNNDYFVVRCDGFVT